MSGYAATQTTANDDGRKPVMDWQTFLSDFWKTEADKVDEDEVEMGSMSRRSVARDYTIYLVRAGLFQLVACKLECLEALFYRTLPAEYQDRNHEALAGAGHIWQSLYSLSQWLRRDIMKVGLYFTVPAKYEEMANDLSATAIIKQVCEIS